MLDEEVLIEAAMSLGGWFDLQAELDALMRRATERSDFTEDLNGYFDAQCSGIAVPDRWRWVGDRPEGQFTTGIRAGVSEWARWAGDGIARAELGADDVFWADCRVYEHRFTVWGYLPYAEMLAFPCLVADFRP